MHFKNILRIFFHLSLISMLFNNRANAGRLACHSYENEFPHKFWTIPLFIAAVPLHFSSRVHGEMHSCLVLRRATKEDASHPSSLPPANAGRRAGCDGILVRPWIFNGGSSEKGECLLSCNLVTRSLGRPHFYASALALIAVLWASGVSWHGF